MLALAAGARAEPDEETEGTADAKASQAEAPASSGWSGLPVVAYLPETGAVIGGYGVHYFRLPSQKREVNPSTVPLLAAFTTKGELGLELTPELFLGSEGQLRLRGDLTGRLRPAATYFGRGNQTRLADEDVHRTTLFGLEIQALHQLEGTKLYVGALQTLEWRRVDELDEEGLLFQTRPPGVEGGVVSGLGPSAIFDSRSSAYAPLRGTFVSLSLPFHAEPLGSDYRFARLDLDAIHFVQLSGEHVLAARMRWQSVFGTAPFYGLAELGGATLLRGYLRGRYIDDHAVSFELEYRFPIYWRFGGVAFVGAGQVAPAVDGFAFDRFRVAGGVGLRFALVPEERLRVRLDVAASPDAVRPYFSPKEAF